MSYLTFARMKGADKFQIAAEVGVGFCVVVKSFSGFVREAAGILNRKAVSYKLKEAFFSLGGSEGLILT
ncbi:MAG: hypothetical protein WAO29_01355 [Candidatus Nanopelagicales bacterium]